jgi:hypothetical protein
MCPLFSSLNRTAPRNQEETPYEGWKGRKPNLSHLHTWGCLAKVHVPPLKKRKLGPKTIDCVFLRYAFHSSTYRFLVVHSEMSNIADNTIQESRDATFFEHIFPMRQKEYDELEIETSMRCLAPKGVNEIVPEPEPRRSKRQS